jgi:hypothetical protein
MPPTYRCPAATPTAPTAGVLPAAVGPTVGPAVERARLLRKGQRPPHEVADPLFKTVINKLTGFR